MPRQGRINIEGGIYHVMQRGLERKEIFRDDEDRQDFVNRLEKCLKDTGSKCYGWVLMPNHIHLVLRTGIRPLGDIMRKLLTGYAMYFNKKYKRSGYVYQNRYKSILCQEEEYLLELIRYIHLNPLRAKIVKNILELRKYKWSGHSIIMGEEKNDWQDTGEILEQFGRKKRDAIRSYEEFVVEGKDQGRRDELVGGGLRRSAEGWSELLISRQARDYRQSDERVLGDGEFVEGVLKFAEENIRKKEKLIKEGWDIKKVAKRVCELFTISEKALHKRSRLSESAKARKVFMYFGKRELELSAVEIARYLEISEVAVSRGVREGEEIVKSSNLKLIS